MTFDQLVTIGIPTYNRAGWLRESLDYALGQTVPAKIIVSDNCSTDNTEEVARYYGDKITYVRHGENIGAEANFLHLANLCDTPFFSWLQDDDGLHEDFVARACSAFSNYPEATAYGAFSIATPSPTSQYFPALYGPPFALNWMRKASPRLIDGRSFIPLSLLMTITMPPVVVYRTEALKKALSQYQSNFLLGERTMLTRTACLGPVIVDPYIGGFFRLHPGQGSRIAEQKPVMWAAWHALATELNEMVLNDFIDWKPPFESALNEIAEEHRLRWLQETIKWPTDIPLCVQTAQLLQQSLPQHKIAAFAKELEERQKRRVDPLIKRALRSVTPPAIWKLGARAKKVLHNHH